MSTFGLSKIDERGIFTKVLYDLPLIFIGKTVFAVKPASFPSPGETHIQ